MNKKIALNFCYLIMMLFKIPNFLSIEECDFLYNKILQTEDYVKSLGEDVHTGTSENSLTGRHWCHNYLNTKEIADIIVPKLMIVVGGRRYVQCWANTFRRGEGIARHCHRPLLGTPGAPLKDWTCTNLFIGGDPETGTWFDGEKNENKRGELMLFSSSLYHWVPPNKSDTIRVSIAMDIHPRIPVGYNTNQYYELK